jgi:tRNA(Ile)-lysidine synthase
VQSLAQTVLEYIRKHDLAKAGDRVGVAVSGGADSVALLRLLLELRREIGVVVSVVHFNHQLRGEESDEDQRFVGELARTHKLEFHGESGDVKARAAAARLSLETAARAMRYEYFRRLLREGMVNRIATGHTLDDQAETVLLRVVRGAGTRGLAGIYPKLLVSGERGRKSGRRSAIVRPLLGVRRSQLESFLEELNQAWREDGSNRDLRHARNRVRHGILPRLERHLNPAAREALTETAEIARAEEEFWQKETSKLLPDFWQRTADTGVGERFKLRELSALPLALQRRLVRAAAGSLGLRLEFRQVEEILALTDHTTAGAVALPRGWIARPHKGGLCFATADAKTEAQDYEYSLKIPGAIDIPEINSRFEASVVLRSALEDHDAEHLLDPTGLSELHVRNWRAGDRYWPAHTREPKKIKELLAERHVTGRERKLWPVIVSSSELVWVRGFPTPQRLQPATGAQEAVVVREKPLISKRENG